MRKISILLRLSHSGTIFSCPFCPRASFPRRCTYPPHRRPCCCRRRNARPDTHRSRLHCGADRSSPAFPGTCSRYDVTPLSPINRMHVHVVRIGCALTFFFLSRLISLLVPRCSCCDFSCSARSAVLFCFFFVPLCVCRRLVVCLCVLYVLYTRCMFCMRVFLSFFVFFLVV